MALGCVTNSLLVARPMMAPGGERPCVGGKAYNPELHGVLPYCMLLRDFPGCTAGLQGSRLPNGHICDK